MSGNQFEIFSESLLKIVKGKALYSGNSVSVVSTTHGLKTTSLR
jgi:hypothetical protein